MSKTVKITDWSGWWEGMRSKMMKAGAESLVTNIGALFTTNGLASMQVPGLQGIGMGWKTAIITTLAQFAVRVVFAGAQYVANKPDPDVITETVDTTHISLDPNTGAVTSAGTSKVVTITPTAETQQNP